MALLALSPKSTFVNVFSAMAIDALHGHKRPLVGGCFVAQRARFAFVLSIEDEFGSLVMVKIPVLPATGVVTLPTIRPQGLLVLVILNMTAHAREFGVLESLVDMTLGTGEWGVLAQQGETCQPMVKLRHFPVAVVMALLALLALLPLVLVILAVTVQAIPRRLPELTQVLVAGLTLDSAACVRIAQEKLGAVMAESALGRLPVLLDVALPALFAQIRLVFVVFSVTCNAFTGCLLEHSTLVTLLAFGLGMFAQQRESGLGVVKFGRILPVLLGVTGAAILPQRLVVLVVLSVTRETLLTQFHCLVELACVATDTFRTPVLAAQGVLGVGLVVESAALPKACGVTTLTLFTKLALVTLLIVIFSMAANTGARRFPVLVRLVALRTLHVCMLAGERKTRSIMIKLGFFPVAFAVATLALRTQRPLVHVVLLVTAIAIVCGTAVFLAGDVALCALGLLVLATKRKVAQRMVKLLLVE